MRPFEINESHWRQRPASADDDRQRYGVLCFESLRRRSGMDKRIILLLDQGFLFFNVNAKYHEYFLCRLLSTQQQLEYSSNTQRKIFTYQLTIFFLNHCVRF